MRQDRPHRGMAVLAAILARHQRIARDVSGVVACFGASQRGMNSRVQPRIWNDRLRLQRRRGADRAFGLRAAGQRRQDMGDGIEPAGRQGRPFQPAAIIKCGAPRSVAVRAMRLQCPGQSVGMVPSSVAITGSRASASRALQRSASSPSRRLRLSPTGARFRCGHRGPAGPVAWASFSTPTRRLRQQIRGARPSLLHRHHRSVSPRIRRLPKLHRARSGRACRAGRRRSGLPPLAGCLRMGPSRRLLLDQSPHPGGGHVKLRHV